MNSNQATEQEKPKKTHYFVLEVTPTREDWIPVYLDSANAIVVRHGGK